MTAAASSSAVSAPSAARAASPHKGLLDWRLLLNWLTEDKVLFSTAELVGLYLREHASDLLAAAVAWSKEPAPEAQAPAIQAPKLILPDDGVVGVPV